MQITSVTIESDLQSIELRIEDAADLVALRYWDDVTWKDYTQVVDLGSKLTGATTEIITVTLNDINKDYFDGIYFFEAEDTNETSVNYVAALTRFEECLIDKARKLSICDECFDQIETQTINMRMLLDSLYGALTGRFIDEILNIKRTLDNFCDGTCQSCGDYGNINDLSPGDTNFDPISIKIDGGRIE